MDREHQVLSLEQREQYLKDKLQVARNELTEAVDAFNKADRVAKAAANKVASLRKRIDDLNLALSGQGILFD